MSGASRVQAVREGTRVLLRIEGRVTAPHCPALKKYVGEQLASGATAVQVCLAECVHIDSTFVGTLLYLKRVAPALTLHTLSPDAQRVLQQMGLASHFSCEDAHIDPNLAWETLASDAQQTSVACFHQTIVEAHEELGGVEGPQRERFRAIAETARRELDKTLDDTWIAPRRS